MSTNDGGPAFPQPATQDGYATSSPYGMAGGGMTLRDYFAAKAPPPPKWWMDCYAKNAQDLDSVAKVLAQWNYVYADAMLEAGKA